ncbi:MAG: DUF1553 domain-containing protein [Verrucomicrobiota bacterium]
MRFLAVIASILSIARLAAAEVDFNRDIRPILSNACFQCHGPDANTRKAKLRLDIEEDAKKDAIIPGNPDASELLIRVLLDDPDEVMPPPKSKLTLTDSEKQLLRDWIAQGAKWAGHWAFETPVRLEDPMENAVDFFVKQKLKEEGLTLSPAADLETQIRRVTLDLTGLPPTPDEVKAFVENPDYEALVDGLFESPRYGERMAWQWLEAARYADTDGYQNDGPRDMWRWRDWVIQAYNQNYSFDRFTIEQLAGDLLPNATLDQEIATGFNRNHRYNSEAGLVQEEFLLENAVDRVDTTSTVWMGVTMACARCHDHKYDPFSQKEYYQLIAYFNRVPESGRAIKFGNSEPWIKAPTDEQAAKLKQLEDRVGTTKQVMIDTMAEIAVARSEWESEATDEHEILADGMSRLPDPAAKIEGLICNGRFTIAFRMNPEQVDSGAVLSSETGDTTRKGILVEFVDGHLRFHIISRWIAGVATLETERKFEPGESTHIMLTNDGSQRVGGMSVYVNGELAKVREIYNTNSNKSGRNFGGVMKIGESKHVGNWKGQVDDLRFYTTKTLSADEAQILAEPKSITEIVAIPNNDRTEAQWAKLDTYFLENAAPERFRQLLADVRKADAEHIKYYDSLPTTMVMVDAPGEAKSVIRERGVYHEHGEEVAPGVPAILPPLPDGAAPNRLSLARWLVSGENPLTARVTVNRYWQLLFGQGLVKTSEDFGAQGEMPSHPQLLDELAIQFYESGWDIQHVLKTIVMSDTYRQSSRINPELAAKDPENRLHARAPRLRLTGNTLRDQALFVSGLLAERQGGSSVKPYQPAGLWKEASNFSYSPSKGSDLYRRSLYTYWKRTLAPPSMAVLDTADREWCSVKPRRTNTPLQSLTLLNETGFYEAARKFGERILAAGETDAARIQFGFQTVAAREPNQREIELLIDAYNAYRESYAADPKSAEQALEIGSSKPAKGDPVEQAAAAAFANVLLNLDEVTTRE